MVNKSELKNPTTASSDFRLRFQVPLAPSGGQTWDKVSKAERRELEAIYSGSVQTQLKQFSICDFVKTLYGTINTYKYLEGHFFGETSFRRCFGGSGLGIYENPHSANVMLNGEKTD